MTSEIRAAGLKAMLQECLLLVGLRASSTYSHVPSDGQLLACKCFYTLLVSLATLMSCHCSCNFARLY